MKYHRFYLLSAFYLVVSSFLCAQINHEWTHQIADLGEVNREGGNEIYVGEDGYIYAQGYFSGEIDFQPGTDSTIVSSPVETGISIYIAKYDSTGRNIWAIPINIVKRNGFILLGSRIQMSISSTGDIYAIVENNNAGADLDPSDEEFFYSGDETHVLLKYDTNGSFQWVKGFDFASDNELIVDKDGNVLLTGLIFDEVDFDPGPAEDIRGKEDFGSYYLAKYDQDGNYIWAFVNTVDVAPAQTFISFGFREIEVDSENNIIISGALAGSVDLDPGMDTARIIGYFGAQVYIVKYDSNGNFLWGDKLQPVIEQNGSYSGSHQLAIDQEDNIIITGNFAQPMDFDLSDEKHILEEDEVSNFIAKYSPEADLIWAFSLNYFSYLWIFDMQIDLENNMYLTGQVNNKSTDFDPGPLVQTINVEDTPDIFVAKYSSDAEYLWAFSMGGEVNGPAQERGTYMAVDQYANLYLTGIFSDTCDFDPSICVFDRAAASINSNTGDAFISKYSPSCIPSNYPIIITESDHVCEGEIAILEVVNYNELFNGNYWFLYQDSCTGTPIDSSEIGYFEVYPSDMTTYFIVGQSCCFSDLNCDSVTINVLPKIAPTFSEAMICFGDSILIFDNYENSADLFTDTLSSISGCDSIHTVELLVFEVDNEVTLSTDGISLIASQEDASYQWYDCDTQQEIAEANMQDFIPNVAGNYAVAVTYNECTLLSDCFFFDLVSADIVLDDADVEIYPNPTLNLLNIDLRNSLRFTTYQLFDIQGSLVISGHIHQECQIDLSNKNQGLYVLRLHSANGMKMYRIMKL